MTVSSSYLSGFSRKFVLKYAFILSVPTIVGAMILEGRRASFSMGNNVGVLPCIIAMITAAVVGFLVIRLAMHLINKKRSRLFAGYCILIGIISAVCYLK